MPLRDSPYQHRHNSYTRSDGHEPASDRNEDAWTERCCDRPRQKFRSNPPSRPRAALLRCLSSESTELRKSNGFYVGPEDAKELKKCICYLVEHRDTAARLGIRGQRFAREILSVELFVKRATQLVAAARTVCPFIPRYSMRVLFQSETSETGGAFVANELAAVHSRRLHRNVGSVA